METRTEYIACISWDDADGETHEQWTDPEDAVTEAIAQKRADRFISARADVPEDANVVLHERTLDEETGELV